MYLHSLRVHSEYLPQESESVLLQVEKYIVIFSKSCKVVVFEELFENFNLNMNQISNCTYNIPASK